VKFYEKKVEPVIVKD